MNNIDQTLINRLALPSLEALTFDDPLIKDAYQAFCEGLEQTTFEESILADPDYAWNTMLADGDKEALARLKVYAALIRPDKRYLDMLFQRTFLMDQIAMRQGQFDGQLYRFGIGFAFREFAQYRNSQDLSLLARNTNPLNFLDQLHGEIASAPGLTWLSSMQFINWTDDWGIALHYMDAENDRADAFPRIVGFFRLDNYPFSAARLLTQLPDYYYHVDGSYVYGSEALLAVCWKRLGDEGEFNIGQHLMELNDDDINALEQHYVDLSSYSFTEDMWTLWRHCMDEYFTDFSDNILKFLLNRMPVSRMLKLLQRFKREQKQEEPECIKVGLRLVE